MSESLTPESVSQSGNGNANPQVPLNTDAPATSPPPSPADSQAERETVKKLLTEARTTREVLMQFRAAIESGSFPGLKMMDLAKGLAFLEAVLAQNQAHISNLQGRN